MLKNEDLKQISKAHTILGMIWAYAIEVDTNELYEKTGITTKDIHDCMKALNHIHTQETIKHKRNSMQSTVYKKEHKERRNIVQNINNAKHRNDKKKLEYWTQKLKEYDDNKN